MHLQQSPVTGDFFQTAAPVPFPWFAIKTYVNRERIAADLLSFKGFDQYLPTYRSRKRWSDRVVDAEQALFPGYVFCRFDRKVRMPILTTPGVISVVGFGGEPAPIDDGEIEAVKAVLQSGFPYEPCAFLREGERIRVIHGCLAGLEGILTRKKSDWRVVVSVGMLQRSISVEVDRSWISKL